MESNDIVSAYRGWDALEKGYGASGAYVIDFDLAREGAPASFEDRLQVLNRLEHILATRVFLDTSDDVFLRGKLVASCYYLRALMGQNIPFDEYVLYTMGVDPVMVTEEEIESARSRAEALVGRFGMQYNRSDFGRYLSVLVEPDMDVIKAQVEANKEQWLHRLDEQIGLSSLPAVRLEYVSQDAFWHNWISGSATEGVRLQINTNPRVSYQKGEATLLALHEICGHAVQMSIWMKNIQEGRLLPELGIVTVHTPEMFQTEGLAQSLLDWIADESELPMEAVLTRWIRTHRLLVYNNAHIRLARGERVDSVFEYVFEQLPFASRVSIIGELRDRSRDPLYRAYRYIYGLSERFFTGARRNMPPSRRVEVLKKVFERPLLPTQLSSLIMGQ